VQIQFQTAVLVQLGSISMNRHAKFAQMVMLEMTRQGNEKPQEQVLEVAPPL
jgi:hypothetical protein